MPTGERPGHETVMARETSLYLDAVRFLAALTVCLGHLSWRQFGGEPLWRFGSFKSAAVDVFFVLSGFVIGYVTSQREGSAGQYALARAARLYSVALPALAITFVLDSVGRSFHPALYPALVGSANAGLAWQYLSGLLFVNRLWYSDVQIGSMVQYWSLGYEVWYYIIFGLAMFAPRRWRIAAVIAAMLIAGPNILMLFPLWLMGLASFHLTRYCSGRVMLGWLLWLVPMAAGLIYVAWAARYGRVSGWTPIPTRPTFLEDYGVAFAFAVNLLGFSVVSSRFGFALEPIARPIRWLAGATFTLYLLHVPIAAFLAAIVPWPADAWRSRCVVFGVTLVSIFLIAEVTERRKAWWRGAILFVVSGKHFFFEKKKQKTFDLLVAPAGTDEFP